MLLYPRQHDILVNAPLTKLETMNEPAFTIDEVLPALRNSLSSSRVVVLQAPPGAGKTTRVPLALLNEPWLKNRSILMLEPRRLAASNAAGFMAGQIGERVGQTVGYSIRYQRRVSRQTRIEVVTEGILTRRLQNDPELSGVGLVIFDEFHERHLQSDLALALCRDSQLGLRDDLKLLVMSATLDSEPLAKLLDAPSLICEGRSFPVDIHYLNQPPQQKIVETTTNAIRRALQETSGDLLVFLPGEGEIRRVHQQLGDLSPQHLLCPLYGSLPFAQQQQAIQPGKLRKIVLATNIAETSLTIEGVTVVIDSGYCRQPRFDSGSGLTRLELCRISQASATQRAGRAGRLGPGTCYRLWTQSNQGTLLPFTPPEMRNADLSSLALELINWGVTDPATLTWLDPPATTAWKAALTLLKTLTALNSEEQLTAHGRALAELPCHPRLGCLLLAAQQLQQLPLGCDLAALLGERDPWMTQRPALVQSRCDLYDRLEELWKRRRSNNLGKFSAIDRASRFWYRYFKLDNPLPARAGNAEQLGRLLAAAFPDRIAKARQPNSRNYLLSSGLGATLDESSALRPAPYLIAVEFRPGKTAENLISLASQLDETTLMQLYPQLPWQRHCYWESKEGRVISCAQQKLGEIILAERPEKPDPESLAQATLAAIRSEGLQLLNWTPAAENFVGRVNFLHRQLNSDNWPDLSESGLLNTLDVWLQPFLGNSRNRTDLKKIDLLTALRSQLDWQRLQQLEQLAPERLQVPSGSQIRLKYPAADMPILAVKLQEMFGQLETPRIAGGEVAVVIHLLSPAGRPLQVTQDLQNFWAVNYHEVKKEMKGRYPKHPWPDDPLVALPTARTKRKELT